MCAVVTRTFPQIIEDIARQLGDVVVSGTATSGDATKYHLIDTKKLTFATDDEINGYQIYITGGTSGGDGRLIDDFDASAWKAIVADANHGEAFTAQITSTSTYIVLKTLDVDQIKTAINRAIREVMRSFLTHKENRSIVLNSPLSNGHFETWTTSSACTGWTEDTNSTFARESSIIRTGTYSAKLTTDGTNIGSLSQSIADFPLYAGKSISLKAYVFTATGDRVRIRLTDGVTTWNSDYHDTTGWGGDAGRYMEIVNKDIDDNATELTASLQVSAGAAVDAYISKMWIDPIRTGGVHNNILEYSIPSGYVYIEELWTDSGYDDGRFYPIPDNLWRIDRENSKIVFTRMPYVSGSVLRIVGQAAPSELSAITDTCDFSDYVIAAAVADLYTTQDWGASDTEAKQNKALFWRDRADKLRRHYSSRPYPGSKVVQVQ